jgi:hypothetical protein
MEYRADRDLFPNGLGAFQKALSLPLVVHNRWMDRKSPYHERFEISGVAVTDRRWWDEVADYLSNNGVVCYEQDWLDRIYANSPEMASKAGVGDAFTDGMADACRGKGLAMQYCMASPRFFLEGLKYPNLTTIRTSDDRFEPRKWADFLFVSQLAQEVGIWPWCDVFKSGETGNMIVSVLSAGPVGTGDRIGGEDKANILRACRPDGVLVKPDRSLLPRDRAYLDRGAPLLASTYTDHQGLVTTYLFAFPRTEDRELYLRTRDLAQGGLGGHSPRSAVLERTLPLTGRVYLYDFNDGTGRFLGPDEQVHVTIGASGYAYLMAVPVSRSGIVLLGDLGKFVPTGKQRIAEIRELPQGLEIRVLFAKNETAVEIAGVSPFKPSVSSAEGQVSLASYDSSTGRFAITVGPEGRGAVTVSVGRWVGGSVGW